MSRLALKLGAVVVAWALVAAGLAGAYSYGQDYNHHRGFTTLVQLRRAGSGRLEEVHFYSRALHRSADYLVYLPPHYSSRRRYPVYYLLHGAPGQPRVFVDIANMDIRLDNQLSLGHARPMILVYPDGRIGGSTFSDSEWANTPSGNFASYVIEVMHNVDQRFATVPRRQDRVIAGFSAGAYGAMNIALRHLSDFANVQSWSGYFTQTRTGVFANASRATLAYNSPLDYIARLRRELAKYPLRAYLLVGRADSAGSQQLPVARALLAAGAQVQYRFYPGGHDWSVWYPRLNQMVALASREVSQLPSRTAAAGLRRIALATPVHPAPHHPRHHPALRLIGVLLLALLSAALINLGFVLQRRGHDHAGRQRRGALTSGFREPVWLLGQATGWIGFAGQIVAVGLAPLTLVQAFSAGSLALSVPLAARAFGHRVTRRQLAAIALIALALVSLPLGFGGAHGHLQPGLLIASALIVMLAGGLLAPRGGPVALAVTAGAFYGTADGAIKAAAIGLRFQGTGVLTGWTLLAALCTLGGFLAVQAALRDGDAVQTLSLMNAFTALAAIALGIAALGERLGSSPATSLLHAAAIVVVLACVRPLAGAQQRLAGGATRAGSSSPPLRRSGLGWRATVSPRAVARGLAASLLGAAALLVASLTALGLLYELRQLRVVAVAPRVPDALPLLQLAGFAAQPLARVMVAMLLAGLVLGLALSRLDRRRRFVLVGVSALLLMLTGSDASYALARNLPFDQVLLNRAPGLGPWLEAVLLTAGSAVPGPIARIPLPALAPRLAYRRALALILAGAFAAVAGVVLVTPSGHAGAHLSTRTPTATLARSTHLPRAGTPSPAPRALRRLDRPSTRLQHGRLFTVHFYSKALGHMADYVVYLPAEYTPARPLPVFYMLHGMPGRPLAFTVNASVETKLESLIRRHLISPMILVFPDGRIGSNTQTDSEWANSGAGRYESYLVNVVHNVDHRFATLPYRQDRAIAGLSAGAYGAANVGLHHIDLFALIQVWSGYFTQTHAGVFAHASHAQLAYNSPLDYVHSTKRTLHAYPLRIFLYVGKQDPDRWQIKPMAAALTAAGADVHYAIYPGGHSWNLWSPRIEQMLIMASRDFASTAISPGATTRATAA